MFIVKKSLSPQEALAQSISVVPLESPTATSTSPQKKETPLQELIRQKALKYNVEASTIAKVIDCESGGDRYAVGDFGHSRGLVQIHNLYHPTITDEQAFDPDFSVDFLAKNLSAGKGSLWTCWRNNFN